MSCPFLLHPLDGGEHEMVCPQAGLGGGLVFPVPKRQKDFYNVVQPEPASGKLLNVRESRFRSVPPELSISV